MEQAADIADGARSEDRVSEGGPARAVLSVVASAVGSESAPVPGTVTEATVRDLFLNAHLQDDRAPVAADSTVQPDPVVAASGTAVTEEAPTPSPSERNDAPAPAVEDAEHEGVEISRRAKEAESTPPADAPPVVEDEASRSGVDPVAAAIASAAAGVDPSDSGYGGIVEVPPADVVVPGAVKEMDYHEALSHIKRVSVRAGHVDIDERITQYVRTNRREALDRPAPRTVKRELRALKNGLVDDKLVQARKVVDGAISSKDIDVQVAIQQVEARKGGKAVDQMKSLSKGPASTRDADPAVMAAAARSKAAPGL